MSHILQRKARLQQKTTVAQDVNNLGVPLRTRYACWIKNCLIDSSSWCLKCRENLPELQSNDLYVVAGSEGDSPFDPSITHAVSHDWLTWDEANLQSSTVYCVKLLDLWYVSQKPNMIVLTVGQEEGEGSCSIKRYPLYRIPNIDV